MKKKIKDEQIERKVEVPLFLDDLSYVLRNFKQPI